MTASSTPGPTCGSKYHGIDAGTNARIGMPIPGHFKSGALSKASVPPVPGLSLLDGKHAIIAAQKKAIELLDERLHDIDVWDEDTQESFLTWFGTHEAKARDLVRRRIVKAIAKLKALRVNNFVADPPPSRAGLKPAQYQDALDDYQREFAYVNPDIRGGNHEMTVHLGPEFATADDTTRAGTLIHEVSHFFTVGQTDDVESAFLGMRVEKRGDKKVTMYGYARAERLSMQSEKNALHNADNFEFFVERQDPRDHFDTEGLGDFPHGSSHGA